MLTTETLSLKTDSDGIIRVGGTRVTLDTIVSAYLEGAAAEEIALQYPSVSLADVYSVIGYYLHHSKQVEDYMKRRQKKVEQVRRQNEARFDQRGIRKRLEVRRASKKLSHASPSRRRKL